MTINVNRNNCNGYFDGVGDGECFLYNGDYYIAAHDTENDDYFGVNLATGEVRNFDNSDRVQTLTATVSFKEIQ